jgi:protein-L-isoaspartate(D-aspartate) O-methyltransferase
MKVKLLIQSFTILVLPLFGNADQNNNNDFPSDWKIAAQTMVKKQIKDRGIVDPKVLDVLSNTPRHKFVPTDMVLYAYDDSPLPIGEGQTISQPYIVALMTELLSLSGKEKVLEIGTGSGYQSAILSLLSNKVYTIEIVKSLAVQAKKVLQELEIHNVYVRWGDGYKGWPTEAPFDCIIVTAAPDTIPEALIKQLKTGGKLVIPVGKYWQELKVISKTSDSNINEKTIIPVRFVPMVHPNNPFSDENLN